MKPIIDVLIPTFNNPQYLNPCIESIYRTGVLNGLARLIIINNGEQPIKEKVKDWPSTIVLEPKENLGWERGLEYGLKHSDAPFVVFQNDDTLIPHIGGRFYHTLLSTMNNENIAAVGPATTVAAGWHSIFQRFPLQFLSEVSYLIFFTVMIRRSDYDAVGGIDTACPGGDDLDLSIRFRKMGKKIAINPSAFLIHHAFKTGERVRGTSDKVGGWNSKDMTDKTNKYLIQKHGFKTFMETMRGLTPDFGISVDAEGDVIRSIAKQGEVLELGCGNVKTIPGAVGMDRVPGGEMIPHVGKISVADIVADVSEILPVADKKYDVVVCRHVLEHCVDIVKTIREWARVLKDGGQLIIAVPNENVNKGIPMNPEHLHGFTPESLRNLMELCGFRETTWADPKNGISFVGAYEKLPVPIEKGELVNA